MRAVVCTAYGSPEVLKLRDRPKPSVKDDEVLVRVYASVVTPSDCAFRKADPFVIRLMYGFRKPKHQVPGTEFAGQIEAVGTAVRAFKIGDKVFGTSPYSFGAHSEYLRLPEKASMAVMPYKTSYEDAVALIDGGLTSLTFLRDVAKIERGQKVLINGASGAVGIYGVQLANYYGAEVTGVCSTANVELVRSHGAHKVIDYTQADFTAAGQTYDVIFDVVGKSSFSRCKKSLKQGGIYLGTVPTAGILLNTLWTSKIGSKKAKFAATGLMQKKDNLHFIRELAEGDNLTPVIDRRFPLEQIADAHAYVDNGRKKGNVVLTLP